MKADIFYSQRAKEVENASSLVKDMLDLARYTREDKLIKIGQALLDLHNPKKTDWSARLGISSTEPQEKASLNKLVTSIPELSKDVPKCGADWFVLKRKPTAEEKKMINSAGYRAKLENGEWVWRLKS